MKSLPIEILHRIFIQLHQHDKLECMTVCSHWKLIIEKYSLCHTVRISKAKQLDKLIRKVRQEPSLGQKVERLILDLGPYLHLKANKLFRYFPNVRSFTKLNGEDPKCLTITEKNPSSSSSSSSPSSSHKNQLVWNNIEQIEETTGCIVTGHLLTFGSCIYLTKIAVAGINYEPGRSIINLLPNAPALKCLKMSNFRLSLVDLEILHKNTPLLRSLILDGSVIDCNALPVEVKPATFVTVVEMKTMLLRFTKDELKLLEYLYSKYPNMVEMAYEVLKTEKIEVDLLETYKEHVMSLYTKIGTKLKKLTLRMNNKGINPFAILDSAGCQIKNLTLTGSIERSMILQLAQSNQSNCVRSLTFDKLDEGLPLDIMSYFKTLKELTIVYSIQSQGPEKGLNKLNICDLLTKIKTNLHSLSISGADLTLNRSAIAFYPLKRLSLIKSRIPARFDHFISESFDRLDTLVLDSCKFKDKALLMPKCRLRYFKIVCSLPKSKSNVLVITLSDNDRRAYTATTSYFSRQPSDINDPFFYPAVTYAHHNVMLDPPYLSFVFDSLSTCFLVNSIY